MNRYPLWKYIVMVAAVFAGGLYTLPNFFGEVPVVQVSSNKPNLHLSTALLAEVESVLREAKIKVKEISFQTYGHHPRISIRLSDLNTQFLTKDLIEKKLNLSKKDAFYTVALNLESASPHWLRVLGATPVHLGLDLRGGVHFLLRVDLANLLQRRLEAEKNVLQVMFERRNVRFQGMSMDGRQIVITFQQKLQNSSDILNLLRTSARHLIWHADQKSPDTLRMIGYLRDEIFQELESQAVNQNISILRNRINELGVVEPLIQQQGLDRIVVQLPGLHDTTKAKEIIGRTATLEARLVDMDAMHALRQKRQNLFSDSELFTVGQATPIYLKKQIVLSGDHIIHASTIFDEYRRPAISIRLNALGGSLMRNVSRNNIGNLMAIVLHERNHSEVINAATIQGEFGQDFQINGIRSTQDANDLALLLRSGSLAAPMDIVEERIIGPSLGYENIKKGLNSVLFGLALIVIFMILYYALFGVFSAVALLLNLIMLVAGLSLLGATLTLPGIAAIALTLGMAIDSNVLINERIREELRRGASPQKAILLGFKYAWVTILDSNVTTLIAGLALLIFGSGPVRGFAVVHCMGIGTSMFSAVFFSRGLVNFWYGSKRGLRALSVG